MWPIIEQFTETSPTTKHDPLVSQDAILGYLAQKLLTAIIDF